MMSHHHHDEDDDKQVCAICLANLFTSSTSNHHHHHHTVGAVVPCGHCLHASCFRQWQQSSYNQGRNHCNCPICNAPAKTFVTLFLEEPSDNNKDTTSNMHTTRTPKRSNHTSNVMSGTGIPSRNGTATVATGNSNAMDPTTSNNTTTTNGGGGEEELQELLAHQERIKNKLKRYKRRNRTLQQELQSERQEMEDMLLSTIQNFYKIMDKHDEERHRWTSSTLELRHELDATLATLQQERLAHMLQKKLMEQDLDLLRRDCHVAQQRVTAATEGLAQLKVHNRQRQSTVHQLLQEKARLVEDNRKLKQVVAIVGGAEVALW
ncbi:expressed unknown protein [Seminavis robusta]|uniref:RING-type domain-containing protein n=1 Tax=Seminavis robusta TaxID=568900 RepID=A0A9N8ELX4_9STRA|nr:expressed unknown protein [Seminavis robusta]|eukprot:Sro1305_g261170.1 n/a (321) ;mRNA; r:14069-15031